MFTFCILYTLVTYTFDIHEYTNTHASTLNVVYYYRIIHVCTYIIYLHITGYGPLVNIQQQLHVYKYIVITHTHMHIII